MSRHLLEDMVRVKQQQQNILKEPQPKEKEKTYKAVVGRSRKSSRNYLWFVALFSAIFCFFAISFLFSKAEIEVNPKTQDITLNENLSASKDPNSDGLFFNLVVLSGEENKNMQASEEKDVSENATGVVVIYNNYDSSSQVLSADTRLEGSNGKIYKTKQKITVPGKSKSDISGSVEVEVYGEKGGSEYNSSPLDFKILGFKGTPKYSKFYGRSKGDITGGFEGKAPFISDAKKTTAILDLKNILQAKLFKKAKEQIPEGFVLFNNASFLNVDNTSSLPSETGDSLTINIKGTFYGFLFNEQKLTEKLIKDNLQDYDDSDVYISHVEDLAFSSSLFSNTNDIQTDSSSVAGRTSLDNIKDINFNLSGSAKIVWKLDTDKFTTDLLGKAKASFSQVLSQYKNINSATLTLSPVWKSSIPDQSKDIKIIINYPP